MPFTAQTIFADPTGAASLSPLSGLMIEGFKSIDQAIHRQLPVPYLGAMVGSDDDHAAWQVMNSHRAFSFISMLSTWARGLVDRDLDFDSE